jgi:hypothetical protein
MARRIGVEKAIRVLREVEVDFPRFDGHPLKVRYCCQEVSYGEEAQEVYTRV